MKTKERWVVKDGSIFCERVYTAKSEYGRKYDVQDSIAFNVGDEVAAHIVKLHNAHIDEQNRKVNGE